jgi:hypothetical protein
LDIVVRLTSLSTYAETGQSNGEETEAGIPVIYFDGYGATVKQFRMKELDEQATHEQ